MILSVDEFKLLMLRLLNQHNKHCTTVDARIESAITVYEFLNAIENINTLLPFQFKIALLEKNMYLKTNIDAKKNEHLMNLINNIEKRLLIEQL
jgi:hypothetical protein